MAEGSMKRKPKVTVQFDPYSPAEIRELKKLKYPNASLGRWLATIDRIMDEFSEFIRAAQEPKAEEPSVKE